MATYSGSDKRLQYLFQHGGGGSLEDLDDVEITNPSDGDALVYDEEEEKWVNGEGGGGNANEQVLTKAEYDALTEEQKMNNTTYYINDADTWTSKEVQPVIYSTEEREIGVWIDGKPLYQKTVNFTEVSISANTWISLVDLSSLNIESIPYATVSRHRNGSVIPFYSYYTRIDNGIFYIYSNMGDWVADCLTIQYTKTTDTAGSGIYTPQGQLAVHYSTEEHVIGTWIDGKPLYERVIYVPYASLTDYGILKGYDVRQTGEEPKDFSGSYAISATYGLCPIGARNYANASLTSDYFEFSMYYHIPVLARFTQNTWESIAPDLYIIYKYTKTTD